MRSADFRLNVDEVDDHSGERGGDDWSPFPLLPSGVGTVRPPMGMRAEDCDHCIGFDPPGLLRMGLGLGLAASYRVGVLFSQAAIMRRADPGPRTSCVGDGEASKEAAVVFETPRGERARESGETGGIGSALGVLWGSVVGDGANCGTGAAISKLDLEVGKRRCGDVDLGRSEGADGRERCLDRLDSSSCCCVPDEASISLARDRTLGPRRTSSGAGAIPGEGSSR